MMDRLWRLISLSVLALLFLFAPKMVNAVEKIIIGGIEEVVLLPWGVKLPARVDTGAAKSSLDAREIKVRDDRVEFKLPQKIRQSADASAGCRVETCSNP